MTDLEAYVKAEGRDELVKQVRSKIKELGITYIYYQFISVTGRIVGKGIPADHWERTAERGFQLVYGSTANLFTDRHGDCVHVGRGQVGVITSGIRSPILRKNIALCRIDLTSSEIGTEVQVGKLDGHQKRIPATVVPFPFYDPEKLKPRS